KLRRLIRSRFLAFRRFSQKAVDEGSEAFWQTDSKLDLDWHVQDARLAKKSNKLALEQFASALASTPLDHSRPLWQFHLVPDYQGGSVLVSRIHHCYADGLALVQVMLSLTDAAPKPQRRAELEKVWKPNDHGSVFERLLHPARKGLAKAIEFGGKALEKGGAMMRDPAVAAAIAKESGEIT